MGIVFFVVVLLLWKECYAKVSSKLQSAVDCGANCRAYEKTDVEFNSGHYYFIRTCFFVKCFELYAFCQFHTVFSGFYTAVSNLVTNIRYGCVCMVLSHSPLRVLNELILSASSGYFASTIGRTD